MQILSKLVTNFGLENNYFNRLIVKEQIPFGDFTAKVFCVFGLACINKNVFQTVDAYVYTSGAKHVIYFHGSNDDKVFFDDHSNEIGFVVPGCVYAGQGL